MYSTVYYLRGDDSIAGAAGRQFASIADAYQHASLKLEEHHGVEVWSEGALVFVVRRERALIASETDAAA